MSDDSEFKGVFLGEMKAMNQAILSLSKEFSDFKQGIGMRVEKHGEDIATIKEQNKTCEDERKVFAKQEDVKDLQDSKKWFVTAVVTGFLGLIFNMFKKL